MKKADEACVLPLSFRLAPRPDSRVTSAAAKAAADKAAAEKKSSDKKQADSNSGSQLGNVRRLPSHLPGVMSLLNCYPL